MLGEGDKERTDCDMDASPNDEATYSCQFLKCVPRDESKSFNVDSSDFDVKKCLEDSLEEENPNNADVIQEKVNCHSILKRTTNVGENLSSRVNDSSEHRVSETSCADQSERRETSQFNNENFIEEDGFKNEISACVIDGVWMIRWNIKEQHDNDFIGLCFVGMF